MDWQILLEQFQANVYPAMAEDLGKSLGLSVENLYNAGVGWIPIVPTSKDYNYARWCFPVRDIRGAIIGLSLRDQRGRKTMYLGSKATGLFYILNSSFDPQANFPVYKGRQSWPRIGDLGIRCPICNGVDGCSVSPDYPDTSAVSCVRQSKGAVRQAGIGWTHILKERKGHEVLNSTEKPVLIVEGMSDVIAAHDIGFVAVGKLSNLENPKVIVELLHGRNIILLGENDTKDDGRWPGKEGVESTYAILKEHCPNIDIVFPPKSIKDLREWINRYKISHGEFLEYVAKNKQAKPANKYIDNDSSEKLAPVFLKQQYKKDRVHGLCRWNERWYHYKPEYGSYEEILEEHLQDNVREWSRDIQILETKSKGTIATRPLGDSLTQSKVQDILMAARPYVGLNSTVDPCWRVEVLNAPDPSDLIVFRNGILHVPLYLNDSIPDRYWIGSTPELFCISGSEVDFDPRAECPKWLEFLNSSLGDDATKIDFIQEWIGYCFTTDMRFQKMAYLFGEAGSGKGTILRMISKLVGHRNQAAPPLSSLATQFGMQPLVGKNVVMFPDVDCDHIERSDLRGFKTILQITGEDAVKIEEKYKNALSSIRLHCKVMIASNGMIPATESRTELERRVVFIKFNRSFPASPLFEKRLQEEAAGVAVWALQGLKRLLTNKAFTIPESSKQCMMEWKCLINPAWAFGDECCFIDSKYSISREKLYDAWKAWCKEYDISFGRKSHFVDRIYNAYKSIAFDKALEQLNGIDLQPWAARRFLGRE